MVDQDNTIDHRRKEWTDDQRSVQLNQSAGAAFSLYVLLRSVNRTHRVSIDVAVCRRLVGRLSGRLVHSGLMERELRVLLQYHNLS